VWDLPKRQQTQLLSPPPGEQVGAGPLSAVSLSPDGKIIATVVGAVRIELRDRATGDLLRTLESGSPVAGVAFSSDGQTLAAAGRNAVTLFDVKTGTANSTISGP